MSRVSGRILLILLLLGSITFTGFRLHINSFIAGFVYLLPVLFIAFRWGFWEATIASVASVLCLDYFFTEPLFAFYMADPRDWIALSAFETVAIIVSRLAMQAKAQAAIAETQQERLEKLYRISREALLFHDPSECSAHLAGIAREVLEADGVAIWDAHTLSTCVSGLIETDQDRMRSAYERVADEDDRLNGIWIRVVSLGQRPMGVLCVAKNRMDLQTLDSLASLAALAMERARAFEEKSRAEAARQSEQLRGAILDGLAHAFKTPLTTIRSASSGLLEIGGLTHPQQGLVELIDQEASRLADFTHTLLTTAGLENGRLKIRREQVRLEQIVQECMTECAHSLVHHSLSFKEVRPNKEVWADPQLLKLAVNQILDNAAKYSDPTSRITLSLNEEAAESVIGVHNEGSFIPVEERHRIFGRFYRGAGAEYGAAGSGIGLSVTKRIVEAHGGSIWVESDLHTGTTFVLTLPHGPKET
jgi:two-component system, OmpR family, sensor histidine kinase KdpD